MNLKPHEIHAALGTLVDRIEKCGGSPELTDAVVLASDLRQAVGNRWNPANEYAAGRVLAATGPIDPESAVELSGDFKSRLLAETQETAGRLNKLNAFMGSDAFPKLPRADKDLLYSQQRVMSEYVQILGKRLEMCGQEFEHAK
jgi:hypothetical protein